MHTCTVHVHVYYLSATLYEDAHDGLSERYWHGQTLHLQGGREGGRESEEVETEKKRQRER